MQLHEVSPCSYHLTTLQHLCDVLPALQGDNFQELYNAFREATKVTEEDLDSFAVSTRHTCC
jgi:hypothetical protein